MSHRSHSEEFLPCAQPKPSLFQFKNVAPCPVPTDLDKIISLHLSYKRKLLRFEKNFLMKGRPNYAYEQTCSLCSRTSEAGFLWTCVLCPLHTPAPVSTPAELPPSVWTSPRTSYYLPAPRHTLSTAPSHPLTSFTGLVLPGCLWTETSQSNGS